MSVTNGNNAQYEKATFLVLFNQLHIECLVTTPQNLKLGGGGGGDGTGTQALGQGQVETSTALT